ncbi:amidohydrolase family protein [Aquimarina gracilis]|uniref:Amidohydrolase family protein n=1 Tax=Aquimarina gracilis TaxID=874422 RepID=A0ABU5ZWJ2_9FLAO|nr:amidohydrolase family protein [Aquimarina gracilis]MEB3346241.1 amidohydrolase family protein [Aquimarina gracilis]
MKSILNIFLVFFLGLTYAQESFIVQNVTLFDGEKITKEVSVLIQDGTIKKIAKKINSNNKVIDGTGKFLMPGMTNAHVHAWASMSLNQAAKAGVLNLLDMHGVEPYQTKMKSMRDSTNYARFYVAGYAATAPEGHGTQYGFPVPTLSKPGDAIKFVEDRVNANVDHIKIIVEPWKPTLSHETVKAVIDEGHKKGKKVVVHVSKVEDGYQVINNNADGLVHIWHDKSLTDDKLKQLSKDKNFFVIPTLLTTILVQKNLLKKTEKEVADKKAFLLAEVQRLHKAGIPILAGTDPPNANINYGSDLYKELVLLSEAKIPNIDILKGATSYPADHFELGKLGYIKEGYIADMLLLEKSPIEDIKNIETISSVWKAGKKVELKQ